VPGVIDLERQASESEGLSQISNFRSERLVHLELRRAPAFACEVEEGGLPASVALHEIESGCVVLVDPVAAGHDPDALLLLVPNQLEDKLGILFVSGFILLVGGGMWLRGRALATRMEAGQAAD
jgi:hypothetical protein